MKRLNLGCGKDYREGYVNLDINKMVKADIYCDMECGLPFEDNTFDYVYSRHCLEHLHKEKFRFVMDEIKRVCKNKAIFEIYAPYFSCSLTFRSLSHFTPITYGTFNNMGFQILKRRLHLMRYSFPYSEHPVLNVIRKLSPLVSFVFNVFPTFYERFFCWIIPMEEIYFKLEIKKGIPNNLEI